MGARRGGVVVKTTAQKFAALLASKGRYAQEARLFTPSAGNVASFGDLVVPGRAYAVTGTLVAPVADAAFANALTCNFNGAPWALANDAASLYRFEHDGTGCDLFDVFMPTAAGAGVVRGTLAAGAAGCQMYSNANTVNEQIQDGSGQLVVSPAAATGAAAVGTATYTHFSYAAPNWVLRNRTAVLASGAQGFVPAAGNPSSPHVIGAAPAGAVPAIMRWFGAYGFTTLTAAEINLVRAYIASQTGIV